jgi:DNA (cytosine-5)-methyltransferase 1
MNHAKGLNYFSTFSGIGGFELGIERAFDSPKIASLAGERPAKNLQEIQPNAAQRNGRQSPACVGFSEINKYATRVYQRHFPGHTNFGDFAAVNVGDLPDFDLLVGGFPCQAFSIAGKRLGFDDTRGTLFFDIARVLKAKRPRKFLLENVKGLLSHDNGRTFKTIISTLVELGYGLEWQVLNSKDFGVPPNRERVFIVGHLRGTPRPEVFPFGQGERPPAQEHVPQRRGDLHEAQNANK